jgi:hypothetical protein
LVATNELRPNNWGTHAGASRVAADVYLGDERDLARAAAVFKGWLGDRSVYDGFEFGSDRSWQADPAAPVGVNPAGAIRDGHDIGGALPDDMRRGCSLRFPPCHTRYPWEALQGALTEAEILSRQGYDTWNWGDQALRRAGEFLFGLQRQYGSAWEPPEGGRWLPWLLNARYGTNFPATAPADPGKGMGYTDWTASGPLACHQADCAAPRAPLRTVEPINSAPTTIPGTNTSPGSSSQQGGASHQGGASQQGGGASLPLVAGVALAAAVVALVAFALLTRRRRRVGSRD